MKVFTKAEFTFKKGVVYDCELINRIPFDAHRWFRPANPGERDNETGCTIGDDERICIQTFKVKTILYK
jgi:hypothetical protein